MVRAKLGSQRAPVRDRLDHGQVGRAVQLEGLQGQQADRAAATDTDAHADLHLRLVHHAHDDRHGFEQAAFFQADRIRQLVDLVLVPDQFGRVAGAVVLLRVDAELLLSVLAIIAPAAEPQEIARHAVADLQALVVGLRP